MNTPVFPTLLQRFFADRLVSQVDASQRTIASYRDAFRLLLCFATRRFGRPPTDLQIEDLDAAFVSNFLDYLECDRGNSPRTRNNRLAALRSFFGYVALNEPALALQCQRILAIPAKRFERASVEFLTAEEVGALVAAPDPETWIGRRDRTLLLLAIQTGLRNSEITSLLWSDIELDTGPHVRCLGKGRKMRCTPLRPDVAETVEDWLAEQETDPHAPVFPSLRGGPMSADAFQRLVTRHASTASRQCPSLTKKRVTPHTLRHTAAMALLHRGVDLSVIALWLGHESTETTQIYLHADMRLKERALGHAQENGVAPDRFQPPDALMTFLESL